LTILTNLDKLVKVGDYESIYKNAK